MMIILYCSDKPFPPHLWNHVGRESNVPPAGFEHIWRSAFISGVAMPKQSDAKGVSLACFPSPSVLRGVWIPACSGRIIARSYAMLSAGGVGWNRASWRDRNNIANWLFPHFLRHPMGSASLSHCAHMDWGCWYCGLKGRRRVIAVDVGSSLVHQRPYPSLGHIQELPPH